MIHKNFYRNCTLTGHVYMRHKHETLPRIAKAGAVPAGGGGELIIYTGRPFQRSSILIPCGVWGDGQKTAYRPMVDII